MKLQHEQIQYIEFLSENIERIKNFYTQSFGWEFTDFGSEYTAFSGEHVDGGFALGVPVKGSVLVVLYSKDLAKTQAKLLEVGAVITKGIFSFPGGQRFQFTDVDGNELAVWSDQELSE